MNTLFNFCRHHHHHRSISFFIKHFSNQSSLLSVRGKPLIQLPVNPLQTSTKFETNQNPLLESVQNPERDFSQSQFSTICNILTHYRSYPDLEAALNETKIKPSSSLLEAAFDHFDSSPKLVSTLFKWAEKIPGFRVSEAIFNRMVKLVCKAREFDSAWLLLLDRIDSGGEARLVSVETFTILIRRYARAGLPQSAIRTFEYASSLDFMCDSDSVRNLFEALLDSLCKEGHVREASEYFDRRRALETDWVPSIRIYNILLNGWFRSRKLKQAEKLWLEMKKENVKPTVVTYGTLVEGYCRMRRVETAMELMGEMRTEGIEPNAVVYNPVVDALGEACRFKEALGMLERFLVLESGPTISTYNSLVKGFCKAKDLEGASKILKMMISRGFTPTPTTYNYFFKYFSKFGKIREGLNLYLKMLDSGYKPDRLTYHLLMKMLCEDKKLDFAVQVSKDMRARGCDLDLATSTMLVHLLCKMEKLGEAFSEFKDMIDRGIVPQYLTFVRMHKELKRHGRNVDARKLREMMASVPHSTNLPNTYIDDEDASRTRRASIMQKGHVMSNILKTCRNPSKLVKRQSSSENTVYRANRFIEDIRGRVNGT